MEGHKDLLVHGPLIATKVLYECSALYGNKIQFFQFKIKKSIYVNEKVLLKVYADKKSPTDLVINIYNISNEIVFAGRIKLIN